MSSYAETIAARLNLSEPLVAIAEGGIWHWPSLGRKGLTRIMTEKAFSDQTGLLKPVIIVLQGEEKPTYEAIHAPTGYMSTETPVFIYVYDNGDTGYANIRAAYDIIYSLLHAQPISGAFQALWKATLTEKREPDLKGACFYRAEFCVYGFRSAS